MKRRAIILAGACIMTGFGVGRAAADDAGGALSKATFAGGCFWCTEAVYAQLKGVKSVTSGYIGGKVPNPTYKQVCTGQTGHAEAIEIVFDPKRLSYEKLVGVFFRMHDPTTLNQQHNDRGTQYRSAIFYLDDRQREIAEAVKLRVDRSGRWKRPIVTEITPAAPFFPAEAYHQDYLVKNPGGYNCHVLLPE
jgi:methionine-S-sulfoxide reductase